MHVASRRACDPRVKEREQDRLVRVVEQLKGSEAEGLARQAGLEEAVRRLDGELAAARARAGQVEATVRARDAAIERLNRQLEATKTHEFESAAQARLRVCCCGAEMGGDSDGLSEWAGARKDGHRMICMQRCGTRTPTDRLHLALICASGVGAAPYIATTIDGYSTSICVCACADMVLLLLLPVWAGG